MAQHDFELSNQNGAAFRADVNEALAALVSNNSGASEPSATYAYQLWADTSAGLLKIRNAANDAWVTIGTLASANLGLLPLAGGNLSGQVAEKEGADVAAAATTNIWATDGNSRHITGSTTITSFGTAPQAGAWMKLIFDSTPILTQGTNLNLNGGGSNITIEAGDCAFVYADTTTQFDVFVIRKSGKAIVATLPSQTGNAGKVLTTNGTSESWGSSIVSGTAVASTSGTAIDFTSIPSWVKRITVLLSGVSVSGTSQQQIQLGTSSGVTTSGYVGTVDSQSSSGGITASVTSGLALSRAGVLSATNVLSGKAEFCNVTGNNWVGTFVGSITTGGTLISWGATQITLGGTLDRVRITTVGGTDTFDAGSINILYE